MEPKSTLEKNEKIGTGPKMARTMSNMNSPKNKIPVTKGPGLAKSPPSINSKITNVKS